MSSAGEGPYQPPKVISKPTPARKMQYMRAYNFIFENANWLTNILMLAVVSFIPILNQLILLGYQYEAVETLHKNPQQKYPDFDFGRFSDYLMRGVWPFLVSLIVSLVMQPVIMIIMYGGGFAVFGLAAAAGRDLAPVVALVGGLFVFVLFFAAIVVMMLVMTPILLRTGLAQDFGQGFKFDWIKDFMRKMWVEVLLTQLFLGATGFVLGMLGLLACFVGIFLVVPLIILASAHLQWQLYELFLARGGEPIPLKQAVPPQAM